MRVGEKIRELRKAHKMKQADLGKIISVSGGTVSSWEIGRTQPTMDIVKKLCEVFVISERDFYKDILDLAPEPQPPTQLLKERQAERLLQYFYALNDFNKTKLLERGEELQSLQGLSNKGGTENGNS